MKKVLITGANKGLGFETAKYLLQHGYFVYLGCRNKEAGEKAIDDLRKENLDHCELLVIDICFLKRGGNVVLLDRDIDAVTKVAEELSHRFPQATIVPLSADVSDPDSVEKAAVQIFKQFLTIHLLVNMQGYLLPVICGRFRLKNGIGYGR